MKTLKIMLLSAGMLLTVTPALKAQQAKIVTSDQDGWRKVAETTVDFEKDKDVLMVFGKDRFSKLQFMVMDAPIEISNMIVYYEGGGRDTINVGARIEEGGKSRVIDLAGGKPEIGRIVFNYNTSNENWNSQSSMSTDKTTRSASTSTTTKKGTTADDTRNNTTVNDNTGTYGNSNTITGSDTRSNTSGTTTTTTGTDTRNNTNMTTGEMNSTTTTTTGRTDTRTNTGTTNTGEMNSGTTTTTNTGATTTQNKNTSKAQGESKLNRSTKARVILWGMK